MTPRETRFNFVISADERAMLDALAAADSRTAGDWLRVTIKAAYAAKFGDKKQKRK